LQENINNLRKLYIQPGRYHQELLFFCNMDHVLAANRHISLIRVYFVIISTCSCGLFSLVLCAIAHNADIINTY